MVITSLGLLAAVAFLISGIPLAWAVFKTPKLVGFSRVGWAALTVGLTSVTSQLFMLHAPPIILGAQVFNVLVVYFVTIQTFRKGE